MCVCIPLKVVQLNETEVTIEITKQIRTTLCVI